MPRLHRTDKLENATSTKPMTLSEEHKSDEIVGVKVLSLTEAENPFGICKPTPAEEEKKAEP